MNFRFEIKTENKVYFNKKQKLNLQNDSPKIIQKPHKEKI